MDYIEHIAKAVEFIEQNLADEIDLAACARACGYSQYHFLRVFKEVSGFTPAEYIRRRRLSEIAKRIYQDNEYVSEIAFAYGLNSREHFSRAFKAEFGILPSEYKSAQNSLNLCEPLSFNTGPFRVLPENVTIQDFSLTVYKCLRDDPPIWWNKYNAKRLSLRLSGGKICEDFGVSSRNNPENRLDYFIGIRTEDAVGDVSGTQEITIAGGVYALFRTPIATHENFVNTIHRTWEYINAVWLRESGYKRRDGYEFESYTEQSRAFSEKIFIPIDEK